MNKDILEKAEKINEERALANEKAYRCICEENTCLQARICPECGGKLDYSFSIQNDPSSEYYKCNECDYEYGIEPLESRLTNVSPERFVATTAIGVCIIITIIILVVIQ